MLDSYNLKLPTAQYGETDRNVCLPILLPQEQITFEISTHARY